MTADSPGAATLVAAYARWRAVELAQSWVSLLVTGLVFAAAYILSFGAVLAGGSEQTARAFGVALIIGLPFVTSAGYGTWGCFSGLYQDRYFVITALTPIRARQQLCGEAIVVLARAVLQAFLASIPVVALGYLDVATAVAAIGLALGTAAAAFALTSLLGLSARGSNDFFSFIDRVILAPLFLVGGLAVGQEQTHAVVQVIRALSPIRWSVDVLLAGTPALVAWVAGLLACAVGAGLASARILQRKLVR